MIQDAAWHARMARLLSGALRLWDVGGTVEPDAEKPGAFILAVHGGTEMRIVRHAPHGWVIVRGREALGVHAGLPGLLRQLRDELAPHAKIGRLIIGAQSLR
jgi:hypothetical protein